MQILQKKYGKDASLEIGRNNHEILPVSSSENFLVMQECIE
jgi:hypothetical protein